MKQFVFSCLMILLILTISACGAQPVPTVNPADVQHTAEAAAFTMVAQTQAAIPTATLLPPTEMPTQTPLPTDTPAALPTVDGASSPIPTIASNNSGNGAPTVDPCANRILSAPKGAPTTIRIANTTKVTVTVSLYLNETSSGRNVNGQGECGWRSYKLTKNNDVVISDLIQGCYNLWAWSDDPKNRFNVASGTSCINNPDKWSFLISASGIKFTVN